jgi:RecJ-like exonuclease
VKDETLLKLSLAAAILGILGIFVFGSQAEQTTYAIYQLDDLQGSSVKITGMITSVQATKSGHTLLQVSDQTGQITVAIFKDSGIDATLLKQGQTVEVEGRVSEYEGKTEVIADSILPSSQSE